MTRSVSTIAAKCLRLALVLGVGALLYRLYDVYFIKALDSAMARTEPEKKPLIRVSRVRLISYDEKGRIQAEVFGRNAEMEPSTQAVRIFPVTLVIYEQGRRKATVLAKEGFRRLQKKQEYFELKGQIEGTTREGTKLFTSELLYYPRRSVLESPVRSKIVSEDHIMEADTLEYFVKDERAAMQGDVRMRFHESQEALKAERNMGQTAWQ